MRGTGGQLGETARWLVPALAFLFVCVALAAIAALTLKVEQVCRTVHRQGSQYVAPADQTTCSWRIRGR